jgi:hypothetical protein
MRCLFPFTAGIAGVVAFSLLPAAVHAQVIRSPVAVLQNTGGIFAFSTDIVNTIDHSGLLTDFTHGVTDYGYVHCRKPAP